MAKALRDRDPRLLTELDALVDAAWRVRREMVVGQDASDYLCDLRDALAAVEGFVAPRAPMTAQDEAERRLESNGYRL